MTPPAAARLTAPVPEPPSAMPRYVPPVGEAPLDAVQQALVRALVRVIVRELREEEAIAAADCIDDEASA